MKGILFKPWKIRAIAEGGTDREWQTRRLSGLGEINQEPSRWKVIDWKYKLTKEFTTGFLFERDDGLQLAVSPYYHGVVYIKEAWQSLGSTENTVYKLDGNAKLVWAMGGKYSEELIKVWRSPLFMPAWAARYFTKILSVRVERLQDITEADCVAEGITDPGAIPAKTAMLVTGTSNLNDLRVALCKENYLSLWDSINPKYPSSTNPWVWVYAFKPVPRPEGL